MTDTTAPAETKVELGTPTVSFDGQTFTIPQLMETVRSLMAKNATLTAEPLTRQEWKDAELRQAEQLGKLDAIASDIRDLHDALLAGFERIESRVNVPEGQRGRHFKSDQRGEHGSDDAREPIEVLTLLAQSFDNFFAKLIANNAFGRDVEVPEIGKVLDVQNTSPSIDGGGNPTVGDGQVAGVETAAPATDAGVDLVLIGLGAELRTALLVEKDANSNHRSTKVTHQVASKILEDAQRAVEAVQSEIRKHLIGGAV